MNTLNTATDFSRANRLDNAADQAHRTVDRAEAKGGADGGARRQRCA